jgi:glycosyltransferase involved in cell wall biosynthesis
MSNLKTKPFNYLLIPFLIVSQIISLVMLLRSRKIDIIHAHWSIPNGVCATIALTLLNLKAKLVCTLHGSDLKLRSYFFDVIRQFVFKKSSAITTASQYLFEQAVEMGAAPSKLSVMSMGVEAREKFIPAVSAEQRDQLLFVGRLIKKKGADILLKAMAIVVATYPKQQLLIVGDGMERKNLEALALVLGISNNVTFVGAKPHNELPKFYQQALIFISPTLAEGFGLTIAEAMACECAVIASDLTAVHDLIRDKKTGLLFEINNSEMLAQYILELLTDKFLCESLMKAARKKIVNSYDWGTVASSYKKMFDNLLDS